MSFIGEEREWPAPHVNGSIIRAMKIDTEATAAMHASMPFTELLALQMVEVSDERAVATAAWAPDKCTGGGIAHGGFLMSLADTLGAVCAGRFQPPSTLTTTIESKTNLFRPVTEGEITTTATPGHTGRRTIVVRTDITNSAGKLVSRTTQTQALIPLG